MRIVGLTGGIATGKSTVSNEFSNLGIPIIDADKIAYSIAKKGNPCHKKIIRSFGDIILCPDGEINRKLLGDIIFSSKPMRQKLNQIMQPAIAWNIFMQLTFHWLFGEKVIILDAPLLFEAKIDWLTSPIVVVSCDVPTQVERLIMRNSLSEVQAQDRIASQIPLADKLLKADYVLDNSGSLDDLLEQVRDLHKKIIAPYSIPELLLSRNGIVFGFILCVATWKFLPLL